MHSPHVVDQQVHAQMMVRHCDVQHNLHGDLVDMAHSGHLVVVGRYTEFHI